MSDAHTNILQSAHPITTAQPPVLDKTAASIAGAITVMLGSLRAAGLMPDIEIPPDVVLIGVMVVLTIAAAIRAHREGTAKRSAAEVVTSLVNEIVQLREQAAAAAITTPLSPVPEPDASDVAMLAAAARLGTPVKRQGG